MPLPQADNRLPQAKLWSPAMCDEEIESYGRFLVGHIPGLYPRKLLPAPKQPQKANGQQPINLGDFKPTSKLYILVHSRSTAQLFSTGLGQVCSADRMAALLEQDGLPRDQREIELLVCSAGGSIGTPETEKRFRQLWKNKVLEGAVGGESNLKEQIGKLAKPVFFDAAGAKEAIDRYNDFGKKLAELIGYSLLSERDPKQIKKLQAEKAAAEKLHPTPSFDVEEFEKTIEEYHKKVEELRKAQNEVIFALEQAREQIRIKELTLQFGSQIIRTHGDDDHFPSQNVQFHAGDKAPQVIQFHTEGGSTAIEAHGDPEPSQVFRIQGDDKSSPLFQTLAEMHIQQKKAELEEKLKEKVKVAEAIGKALEAMKQKYEIAMEADKKAMDELLLPMGAQLAAALKRRKPPYTNFRITCYKAPVRMEESDNCIARDGTFVRLDLSHFLGGRNNFRRLDQVLTTPKWKGKTVKEVFQVVWH